MENYRSFEIRSVLFPSWQGQHCHTQIAQSQKAPDSPWAVQHSGTQQLVRQYAATREEAQKKADWLFKASKAVDFKNRPRLFKDMQDSSADFGLDWSKLGYPEKTLFDTEETEK
jgi:hypothetical protein